MSQCPQNVHYNVQDDICYPSKPRISLRMRSLIKVFDGRSMGSQGLTFLQTETQDSDQTACMLRSRGGDRGPDPS